MEEVKSFLKKMGVKFRPSYYGSEAIEGGIYGPKMDKFLSELAYLKLKSNGFGGHQRSIYCMTKPEFQNITVSVEFVKFVKTGTYFPPSVSTSYEGEVDYDSGGLTNEKTHKILGFYDNLWGRTNWIEAKNVEKLIKDE